VHKCLLVLSFLPAAVAAVLHKLAQVCLFVKLPHLFLVALLAQSCLFEGSAVFFQAGFVVIVLAKCALKHGGFSAPTITLFANADLFLGDFDGGVFHAMRSFVSRDEVVYFYEELPGREPAVMRLQHFDEGVEVVGERAALADGERLDIRHRDCFLGALFFGH
jgi:hypothetical protein